MVFNKINNDKKPFIDNASDKLESMGWIRLHGYTESKWIVPIDKRITKSQKKFIIEWSIEKGLPYQDCFHK